MITSSKIDHALVAIRLFSPRDWGSRARTGMESISPGYDIAAVTAHIMTHAIRPPGREKEQSLARGRDST